MNLLQEGIESKSVLRTSQKKNYTIDNHTSEYVVYKIRLDCLYFNDQNDRIATWLSQYKSDHGVDHIDTTDKGYNQVIHEFIRQSNEEALKKTEKNIEMVGQREAGVVLTDGRIIDGNRRFTCLRNLQQKTGQTQYFDAVVLEHDITHNAKQIKMLELYLQLGVDKPIDYDPIDRLVGIYNDIVANRLLTVEEYATAVSANQSKADVQREVERAKLMVDFLNFISAPKQFHLARKLNLSEPLKELYTILKQCRDEDKREDIKTIIFSNFISQPHADMTRYIRKIKKVVSNSKLLDSFLEEQLALAEKVCDIIEEHPVTSEQVINEHIRTHEDIQEDFAYSTDKFVGRADSDASRNRPAQEVDKAYEALDRIDTKMFQKMTDSQKDDVRKKLNLIQETIESIRGELDV